MLKFIDIGSLGSAPISHVENFVRIYARGYVGGHPRGPRWSWPQCHLWQTVWCRRSLLALTGPQLYSGPVGCVFDVHFYMAVVHSRIGFGNCVSKLCYLGQYGFAGVET